MEGEEEVGIEEVEVETPEAEAKPPETPAVEEEVDDLVDSALELHAVKEVVASGKPVKLTKEEFQNLSHETKLLLGNFALRAKQGQEELARAQAAAEAAKKAQVVAERQVLSERAQLQRLARAPGVREHIEALRKQAAQTDVAALDLYTPEGMAKAVEAKAAETVANMMDGFWKSLDQDAEKQKQELEAQAKAEQQQQLEARWEKFMGDHADDFAEGAPGFDASGKPTEFYEVVKAYTKRGFDIEEAYSIADSFRKAHQFRSATDAERNAIAARSRPGSRKAPIIRPQSGASTEEWLEFYAQHPDALKADSDPRRQLV